MACEQEARRQRIEHAGFGIIAGFLGRCGIASGESGRERNVQPPPSCVAGAPHCTSSILRSTTSAMR